MNDYRTVRETIYIVFRVTLTLHRAVLFELLSFNINTKMFLRTLILDERQNLEKELQLDAKETERKIFLVVSIGFECSLHIFYVGTSTVIGRQCQVWLVVVSRQVRRDKIVRIWAKKYFSCSVHRSNHKSGMRNETLGDELLDREKGGRKSKEFAFRKGTKASTEFVFIPSLKHIRRPTKDFVTKIKSNSHAHVSMATNWVNSLRIFLFFFSFSLLSLFLSPLFFSFSISVLSLNPITQLLKILFVRVPGRFLWTLIMVLISRSFLFCFPPRIYLHQFLDQAHIPRKPFPARFHLYCYVPSWNSLVH